MRGAGPGARNLGGRDGPSSARGAVRLHAELPPACTWPVCSTDPAPPCVVASVMYTRGFFLVSLLMCVQTENTRQVKRQT